MRPLLLGLLLTGSHAGAESLPVDPHAWQGMNRSVHAYHERYGPAPVEARPVFRLWKNLAERGQPIVTGEGEDALSFERVAEPDASGVARNRQVHIVRIPERGDGPLTRVGHARGFSHLVASSEDWSRGADGARRAWKSGASCSPWTASCTPRCARRSS